MYGILQLYIQIYADISMFGLHYPVAKDARVGVCQGSMWWSGHASCADWPCYRLCCHITGRFRPVDLGDGFQFMQL